MVKYELSLNPYCSGQWSRTAFTLMATDPTDGLNPYCSGQWSRTIKCLIIKLIALLCLNPYCSGQWSRTHFIPSEFRWNTLS